VVEYLIVLQGAVHSRVSLIQRLDQGPLLAFGSQQRFLLCHGFIQLGQPLAHFDCTLAGSR
jgi:hypothetical protein